MLQFAFLITNIVCALLLGLTYMIPYIDPHEIDKFPILGLFYPILLLLNVCFFIAWLFTESRHYSLISLFVVLIGIQHFNSLIGTTISQKKSKENIDFIKVSSYNIKNFNRIKNEDRSFQPEAIKRIVSHLGNTQYLCVQENGTLTSKMLSEALEFPYSHGIKGTKIFSRQPLLDQGEIDFGNTRNSCTWVNVPFKENTVRLYSVHLESNHITQIIKTIFQTKNISILNRLYLLKRISFLYTYNNRVRVQQAEKILNHIQKSPHPVIVCGDFNDSPISYIYNKFTTQLTDGFMQQGKGLGFSFRSIPFLRIDYILADNSLEFKNYKTVRALTYSDHFPVTADISVY